MAAVSANRAGILAFVNAWDEFLLALSLNASASMRTLPVGITLYQGEFTFPWPIISAALIVAIVPVCILIAIFQERVVGGLTAPTGAAETTQFKGEAHFVERDDENFRAIVEVAVANDKPPQ